VTTLGLPALNLLLTYRCNFTCRHCISECTPARQERMTLEDARRWIDEAVEGLAPKLIGYTGGEPFLLYRQLQQLVDYGQQRHGIASGIVTNCFWATSTAATERRVRELHALGLRSLVVSCDDHHLEYVPVEHVKRATQAALALEISVCVNTVVTRNGSICKNDVPRLLGLSRADIERGAVTLKEFGPLKIGRAAKLLDADEYIETSRPEYFDAACPYVTNIPSVTPDGSVFACCCFGNAAVDPEQAIGDCGDARANGLSGVLSRMRNDLLFSLFSRCGPFRVLQRACEAAPHVPIRGRYLCTCDVCVELYHNPELRRTVSELLSEWSVEGKRDCA
jgi:pyruvate-formate lyase-activating enzyme